VNVTSPLFPPSLKDKIPRLSLMFVEQRIFCLILGFALYACSLNGPVVGKPDHNGFRYLIGPFVCALIAASFFVLRPFNPYRGPAARLAGLERADESDPEARRLVELFRSSQAHRFIWRTSAKMAVVCFLLMRLITLADRNSMDWSISSSWTVPGLMGSCIGSYIAIGKEYIGWGLKVWAKRDGEPKE
jgi:hypothetical protein